MTKYAFPHEPRGLVHGDEYHGMTLRDWFAGQAGEPPREFVAAYKDAHPMGQIKYTYGNADEDRSRRKHDLRLISEYHASIRSAWATSFADAMLAARNNNTTDK